MKFCFEELNTFLSMWSDIHSSAVESEEAAFSNRRGFHDKKNYIFQWEFMMISICD